MLLELRVRDLAILEDVSLSFGPGLNVLTGETGAGKSILLKALALVLGSRADADLVRAGRAQAEVEARFERSKEVEHLLAMVDIEPSEHEDGIVLRRVVTQQGRSRAYVAGVSVTNAVLQSLGKELVDYGSQHEHQVLLDEARHLPILDRFGRLDTPVAAVELAIDLVRDCLAERARLQEAEDKARSREDWLRFQLDELERVGPEEGEDERLDHERALLRNAEKLSTRARQAEEALSSGPGSAVDRLAEALRKVEDLEGIDEGLATVREQVATALDAATEAGRDLVAYSRKRRSDPERLDVVDERLSTLRALARKHRTNQAGLVALQRRIRDELDEITHLGERIAQVEAETHQRRVAAATLCAELGRARRAIVGDLARRVEEELGSLGMARATFRCDPAVLGPGADRIDLGDGRWASRSGTEELSFQLSANAGEPLRSLARVASGGELSRILLAIRRALADTSTVQCCVFDEVDAGLGGQAGIAVARKLQEVARSTQVICITHLPQIASRSDHHLRVEKTVEGGRTRTGVRCLDGLEREREIARMLGGDHDAARIFARALLDGDAPATADAAV